VVTSPPYWNLRDYGTEGQLGLEPTYEDYVQHIVEVCRELWRVLTKDGSFYLNLGDTYAGNKLGKTDKKVAEYVKDSQKNLVKTRPANISAKCLIGIPWRVALALIDDGWILRNDVIWHKPNCMPSSVKDRLTNTYEHIFHFVKSRKYYYNLDAIRQPHKSKYAPFNIRVRDAQKGRLSEKWGTKYSASESEITAYNEKLYTYIREICELAKQYRSTATKENRITTRTRTMTRCSRLRMRIELLQMKSLRNTSFPAKSKRHSEIMCKIISVIPWVEIPEILSRQNILHTNHVIFNC